MVPINEYFKSKGIDVSTEGINGMPMDGCGYFSAFWHNSSGIIYHGKVVGGGYCIGNNWVWGTGASIDADFYYGNKEEDNIPDGFQEFSMTRNWDGILDLIFLGSILYQYLIKRTVPLIINKNMEGSCGWLPAWYPGRSALIEFDIGGMISPHSYKEMYSTTNR